MYNSKTMRLRIIQVICDGFIIYVIHSVVFNSYKFDRLDIVQMSTLNTI